MHVDALVLVAYGNQGIAELADGSRVECAFRRSVGRPLCGDRVVLERADGESFVVTAIEKRKNVFVRADRQQRQQAVASNLDQVLIVIAPHPAPSKDLVERYLVAVHSLGIRPVLVVNKSELLDKTQRQDSAPFCRLEAYRNLGYAVVEISCREDPGVTPLSGFLDGAISILVGQSGVGKSSIVNRLIPDLDLQTGSLSHSTGKGTHTTTTTIMYSLPQGGRLVDSPGVWEYGLWSLSTDELAAGFPEFAPFVNQCRFNDCEHRSEPGCGVASAVEQDHILPWRYHSYLRLVQQAN